MDMSELVLKSNTLSDKVQENRVSELKKQSNISVDFYLRTKKKTGKQERNWEKNSPKKIQIT